MFRGSNKLTVDAKGRMAIPSSYHARIQERSQGRLIVTVDRDKCLLIYPTPDWEDIESKLMSLPSFNPTHRQLQRLMVGEATDVQLDAQGRVLIPPTLREYAGLGREVRLLGQRNRFELWDEMRYQEQQKAWSEDGGAAAAQSPELETMTL